MVKRRLVILSTLAVVVLVPLLPSQADAWEPTPTEREVLVDAFAKLCGGTPLFTNARILHWAERFQKTLVEEGIAKPEDFELGQWEQEVMVGLGCIGNLAGFDPAVLIGPVSGGVATFLVGADLFTGYASEGLSQLMSATIPTVHESAEFTRFRLLRNYDFSTHTEMNCYTANAWTLGPSTECENAGFAHYVEHSLPYPTYAVEAEYLREGHETLAKNTPEATPTAIARKCKAGQQTECEIIWISETACLHTPYFFTENTKPGELVPSEGEPPTFAMPSGWEYVRGQKTASMCAALPTNHKVDLVGEGCISGCQAHPAAAFLPTTALEFKPHPIGKEECPSEVGPTGEQACKHATHGGISNPEATIPEPPGCFLFILENLGFPCEVPEIGSLPESGFHFDPPELPEVKFPEVHLEPCHTFPFGLVCWPVEYSEELSGSAELPVISIPVNGEHIEVNLNEEPISGIVETVRWIVFTFACIGAAYGIARFAFGLNAGEE